MGLANALNTIMNTAYSLLIDTVFYIMAITTVMGAFSALLTEFGVVDLINYLLAPIMQPVYGLPGCSALGIVASYLSDNPAILVLADDKKFCRHFTKRQLPAITNLGTAFGMGLIVTTFMLSLAPLTGKGIVSAVLIGNLGALIGSVVSTRLMLCFTNGLPDANETVSNREEEDVPSDNEVPPQERIWVRGLNAILRGGKSGFDLGIGIIPGVLVICTLMMMLSNNPPVDGFTGAAYEGIGLLPAAASKINFIIEPLFGFNSPEAVAVPLTALGAAGAAIGLVPKLISDGTANIHDIAVFTATCMCWSGFLSTHVAMMERLKCTKLVGKAILSHTIGGLCAGIAANWLFKLIAIF